MVFPGTDWVEMSPESQGVDSLKLITALNYLESNSGSDGIREVAVIRNGHMIWKGDNIDKRHEVFSCTKVFTSTVMGLLVDDEMCSPATLAKDFVPSLSIDYFDLTLAQFATMTSGYDAEGGDVWSNYLENSITPWVPTDPFFAPGQAYLLWNDSINMMAHVLTQIAQESIYDLFKRRIADPIGIDPDKWAWGHFGTVEGFLLNGGTGAINKGIEISTREMARFGHLFLNRGNWDGTQIISTDWVDEATQNHVSTTIPLFGDINTGPEYPHHMDIDRRGIYGYFWVVNGIDAAGNRHLPDAPLGTFYIDGYNDNFLVVVPEWDLVIVRLGSDETISIEEVAPLWNNVLKLISEALLNLFYDDFESGLEKWIVSGSDWALIDTDSVSSTHAVTESPDGDFIPNENAVMTLSNPIDLSGKTTPTLSFWHKMYNPDCSDDYDRGFVEISEDGGISWTVLATYYCVNIDTWTQVLIDLSDYAGSAPVKIRFRFSADDDTFVGDGWYIDDVSIQLGDSFDNCPVFADIPLGFWAEEHICKIYDEGITQGCSQDPLMYCPKGDVTRDQMAAFLVRAVDEKEPPDDYCDTGSPFADVSQSAFFCKYIKRLSELEITQGCGGDKYCPKTTVTRDQMAAFLVRAVYGEPPADYCDSGSPFADVLSTDNFCKYIKKLSELGITKGCGGDNYCPKNIVKRDQMAVFLGRAFLDMD
jgi:CubicO group peptidase (beta-lactamase class C family)